MVFRRLWVLTSIVLLTLIFAACQPAANDANGGLPATGGNQTGENQTGGDEPAAGVCEDIDTETLVQTGNNVYSTRCASCHAAAGEGAGTFPGLTNAQSLNTTDVTMTLQTFFNPEIHPFIDDITNMDVAAVLSFVGSSFGNNAPVICPEHVDVFRPAP